MRSGSDHAQGSGDPSISRARRSRGEYELSRLIAVGKISRAGSLRTSDDLSRRVPVVGRTVAELPLLVIPPAICRVACCPAASMQPTDTYLG